MAETPGNEENIVDAKAEQVEISDIEDAKDPESDAPADKKRWTWPLYALVALVVVVAGAAGVMVVRPDLAGGLLGVSGDASADRVAALARDMERVKADIRTLQTAVTGLQETQPDSRTTDALAARLDALEKRLAETAQGGGAGDAAIQELSRRVAALENAGSSATADVQEQAESRARALQTALAERDRRIAQLGADLESAEADFRSAQADNQRLVDAVNALASRVAKVEKSSLGGDSVAGSTAALVVAVGQLREALATSAPFTAELDALKALAADDAAVTGAVEILAPHAATGIRTRNALAASFDPMARRVVQATAGSGDGGWWDRAISRLSGLVTVRPTGADVEGDTPAARLARSEARLNAGDLDGAVQILAPMEGAAAREAADWLARARARLAADRAMAELSRDVIGRIAQSGPSPRRSGFGRAGGPAPSEGEPGAQ